jgi:hypothetical protein
MSTRSNCSFVIRTLISGLSFNGCCLYRCLSLPILGVQVDVLKFLLVPDSLLDKLAEGSHIKALENIQINSDPPIHMMREVPCPFSKCVASPPVERPDVSRILEDHAFR